MMPTADANLLLQSVQQIAMQVFSSEIRRITDLTNPASSLCQLMDERDAAMKKWMKEAIVTGIHESFKLHKSTVITKEHTGRTRSRSLDNSSIPMSRFRRKDEQAPLMSEYDPGDHHSPARHERGVESTDEQAEAADGKSIYQTPQSSGSIPGSLRKSADDMFQTMDDRHQSLINSTHGMSPVQPVDRSLHDYDEDADVKPDTSLNASLDRQQNRQHNRNWESVLDDSVSEASAEETKSEAPTFKHASGGGDGDSSASSGLPLGLDSPPAKIATEQEELVGTPSIVQRVKERTGAHSRAKADEATASNTANTKSSSVSRNLAPIFSTTPAKSTAKKGKKGK
jgi:hypothetical protein